MTKKEQHPMKHDNGKTDKRYVVTTGNNAQLKDVYILRFCSTYVGQALTYAGVCAILMNTTTKF